MQTQLRKAQQVSHWLNIQTNTNITQIHLIIVKYHVIVIENNENVFESVHDRPLNSQNRFANDAKTTKKIRSSA